ncbi:hypothetical protein TSH100_09110 [Azospirillum sp. TSH100]|uniref:hypothetical protein n=1 Tax=Azospirillum sp. TSH100 TaxID=652764 RepID=UPI000D604AA1|nr:hypothetical protein [Azospirillum sp. TSH100]PWC87715.1 hypothetical protein TSH100_09110 [Azospirillum sp. TSH100]QCG88184.1 hypothetical protein E6C72_10935 [Azospirillum sp. TSH100]
MAANDRNLDSRKTGDATGPDDSGGIDERKLPLDIPQTRDHVDVDEQIEGFQRVIGPGAGGPTDQPEEDFGIPGSEEAGGLGTGPLPPRQPDRPQGQAAEQGNDRIVSDRNVAVDGARDRK